MNDLHWVAAVTAVVVVVLEGDRTGWLIVKGTQRGVGALLTRVSRLSALASLAAGLFVRAAGDEPFRWFHAVLLASLLGYGLGLLLLRRRGASNPT